jgi:hypothetical protein
MVSSYRHLYFIEFASLEGGLGQLHAVALLAIAQPEGGFV